MLIGYNTNGFANHELRDTLTILSEIGYAGVALTLDRAHLEPPDQSGVAACIERIKPLIEAANLRVTIETGSRFILDPRRKHQPTLISACPDARRRRIEFLAAAIEVAAALQADSVSLWSGAPDDEAGEAELFDRLTASLREVLDYADTRDVRLSFEPEPGMFIDTMSRFGQLHAALDHARFGLTLDIGHACCLDEGDLGGHVNRWLNVVWNVHIEDMHRGAHEHLMFGEGDIEFAPVFDALTQIDYQGPVHVELSRHSHDAVEAARRSYKFLRPFVQRAGT